MKKAVLDCGGFDRLNPGMRVFIKPNIVFWTKSCSFPKWGVITTSRIVEDMVVLLKEFGIDDITIGEGIAADPGDEVTPAHAFNSLGYNTLCQRYGIKCVNIMKEPFKEVEMENGVKLKFNRDVLESDFLVDLPVLKSHNQTKVSLGLKNLKGTINIASRKKCHSPDPEYDLHYYVSRLGVPMPPALTVIDGIYSLERGPAFDGRMKRSNLLVASPGFLSADLVGSRILGHDPSEIKHLALAASRTGWPLDLSDIEIIGENVEDVSLYHEYDFVYISDSNGEMPRALARQGLRGLFYRKFDDTMCTYCSSLNGLLLTAIRQAWTGEPWNNVEVLTGKKMEPAAGMGATILIGQCMYNKNKEHPNIQTMFSAKGCPPDPREVVDAFHGAGIELDRELFDQADKLPGFFLSRYEGNPEFDESFYRVD